MSRLSLRTAAIGVLQLVLACGNQDASAPDSPDASTSGPASVDAATMDVRPGGDGDAPSPVATDAATDAAAPDARPASVDAAVVAPDATPIDANPNVVMSSLPRAPASATPPADITTQTYDDQQFAFDVYAKLSTTPGNIFFSPYSISTALAMSWAGADGTTATAMATTLHLEMPAERVQAARNAIALALAGRSSEGTSEGGGDPFQLNVANALWAQRGLSLETPFLDTLAEDYGAGVRLEDFSMSPALAVVDINSWVNDATAGKIPTLLTTGDITADTRVVLTNAVYFHGSWQTAFDVNLSRSAVFHSLDGSAPSVPFMESNGLWTRYASGSGWQVVELPYSNPHLTMTLIVPDAGQFSVVEAELSATFLASVVTSELGWKMDLTMPKFSATTSTHLAPLLSQLGMAPAFTPGVADFSGIDGAEDLFLSDVVHQATVTVDEAGTSASAATAAINNTDLSTVTLTIDRPFFIVLRDIPTGAILFLGRIVAP